MELIVKRIQQAEERKIAEEAMGFIDAYGNRDGYKEAAPRLFGLRIGNSRLVPTSYDFSEKELMSLFPYLLEEGYNKDFEIGFYKYRNDLTIVEDEKLVFEEVFSRGNITAYIPGD